MVRVASSRGGFVNVEIKGVVEILRFIRAKGQDVEKGSDAGVFRAATFVQQEVQESIIGNRPEPKSVATGRFGNSITVDKIDNSIYKIFPKKVKYPNSNTTTQDVAKFLEYGTSKHPFPRHHFQNTKDRTKEKVKKEIAKAIKSHKRVLRGSNKFFY